MDLVPSLVNINAKDKFLPDYQRFKGLESVIVANVVSNSNDVIKGQPKELTTMVSFDDGAHWQMLQLEHDQSSVKKEKYLHLQLENYLTRSPKLVQLTESKFGYLGDMSSTGSNVGVGIAQGSEGKHLRLIDKLDTFITLDAGATWRKIKGGRHKVVWCAQGAAMLSMRDDIPLNSVEYSLDLGHS